MKKDYIITFATECIVMATGILVYKFAADYLGRDGFSEYALSRRIVYIIQPILLMGLSIGIPRYIARSSNSQSLHRGDGYFIAGMLSLGAVIAAASCILNLFDGSFAYLFFGDQQYAGFIAPINLMIAGLIMHTACYSYFRGKLHMAVANILQVTNLSFVFIAAFLTGSSAMQVLYIIGTGWILISLIFAVYIIRNVKWDNLNIMDHARELLHYGLQRVPGDFGLAALFTLPAFYASHTAGVKEAGSVAFSMSLLRMAGQLFAPIGLILLPKASQILAEKNFQHLRDHVKSIYKIALSITILIVLLFELAGDRLIYIFLGDEYSDLASLTKIVMLGSIPFVVYVSMRSVIDAYYVRSVNTFNILYALLFFLVSSFVMYISGMGYISVVVCFLLSLALLGVLTSYEAGKILKKEASDER